MATRVALPSLFQHKDGRIPRQASQGNAAELKVESDQPKCLQRTMLAPNPLDTLNCFALGSPFVYTGDCSGIIRKFNLNTGDELVVYRGHTDIVRQLEVVHDKDGMEQSLFSVSRDKTLRGFDAATGRQHFSTTNASSPFECLATSSTNVFVGAGDGTVLSFSQRNGEQLEHLRIHSCNVKDIVCQGNMLYTCSLDCLAKCTDISSMKLMTIFEGMSSLRCIALMDFTKPQGEESLLVAGASAGEILAFDRRTSRRVFHLQGHSDAVLCLAVRDFKVWSGGDDCTVRQWDLRTGTCEYTYTGFGGSVHSVLPEADGTVVAGSLDRSVYVWEMMDPRKHCRAGLGVGVAFSALLNAHFKKYAKLTDADGNKCLTPRMWKDALYELECRNVKVVDMIFRKLDTTACDELEFSDVASTLETQANRLQENNLNQAFTFLDSAAAGEVTLAYAQTLLAKEHLLANAFIPRALVSDLCKLMQDGKMDFDDFKYFVTSSPKLLMFLMPLTLATMAAALGMSKAAPTAEEEQAFKLKYEASPKGQGKKKKKK